MFSAMYSGDEPEDVITEVPVKKSKTTKKDPNIKVTEEVKEIRATLQMPFEIHKKIKIMAHWELTSLKDIINKALEETIVQYEKTHGELVSVPKSQKKK
jgi:hypothetical protein